MKIRRGFCTSKKLVLGIFIDNPGSFARLHIRASGQRCYRLLTADFKPLLNIRISTVDKLVSQLYLNRGAHACILSALGEERITTIRLGHAKRQGRKERKTGYAQVIHKVINK